MSLLKNKNFSVLWFGQLATIFGNRFSEIAIPLIVLQLTGSPWQAALVVVCSQVAPLVLSLPVGTWIESKSKKQVAMSAEAISFFTMCTLVTFVLFDQLNIWILAGSLLILGATGLFFKVSFGAMVPRVSNFPLIIFGMFLFDGALSMAFVVNGSARQAITPDNYLARISGGGFLLSGLVGVSGNLFAGGTAELIAPQISFVFCAIILLVASLISLSFKQGNKQLHNLKPIEFREGKNQDESM